MSDLSRRYGLCVECGEYAVHLAVAFYSEFIGDDEDMLHVQSVYANETAPHQEELLAHICFKCGHIEDVGDCVFCEREHQWTSEWPTAPGMYWFYGRETKYALEDSMQLAEARIVNGYMVVGSINNLDRNKASGLWSPANLPEPPIDQLKG